MIQMLSSFDLKPDAEFEAFEADYEVFLNDLRAFDLIVDAGSLGRRVTNTPMDTDTDRTQQLFSIMYFRDRAQLDAAYAHIDTHAQPSTQTHLKMYHQLTNAVFLCWEDIRKETP